MSVTLLDAQKTAPADIKALVNFLRGKAGPKLRTGVLNGKRVEYFKGTGAVKSLLSPAYSKIKNAPKVTTETEVESVMNNVIRYGFFLKVDRGDSITLSNQLKTKARALNINQMQMFAQDQYYAWFYEGPQWTTYVGGAIMVFVLLAGVMFPLWPPMFRQGVSYLSMGVLGLIGLFFIMSIFRLIFWIITIVVAPPGIWIFPQLFADVGFFESFVPLWAWDIKESKKKKKSEKPEKSGKSEKNAKDKLPGGEPKQAQGVKNGLLRPRDPAVPTDSDTSRAPSRGPTIEEVPDEDA